MLPQSLLLAAVKIPHYIHYETQTRVLNSYRKLHRLLNRLEDSLARKQLKELAQHNFARYKYISSTTKINALLDYADTHEFAWAQGIVKQNHKDLFKCLELAFTTYKVKQSPLKHFDIPNLRLTKDIIYRLNNVEVPRCRDFEGYKAIESKSLRSTPFSELEPYWQLVKLMKTNNISTGKQKRKLMLSLRDLNTPKLTVLGTELPKSRQANMLKRLYVQFLRDVPRPVHPDIINHIEEELSNKKLKRVYRRRLKELGQMLYSLDSKGSMRKVDQLL